MGAGLRDRLRLLLNVLAHLLLRNFRSMGAGLRDRLRPASLILPGLLLQLDDLAETARLSVVLVLVLLEAGPQLLHLFLEEGLAPLEELNVQRVVLLQKLLRLLWQLAKLV